MAILKSILFLSSLSSFTSLIQASPLNSRATNGSDIPTFDNDLVFSPPVDYNDPRVLYARTAELTLSGNTLLATWENYSPEPPLVYFPIYESTDHGVSWTHISNCTDQVNGWGLRYQPFLYELPVDFAGYAAGAVLLAGNSIPANLSNTQIDVYVSEDKGYTWKFLSHVAAGGEAEPDNGLTPVWEPFLMIYDGQLVIYYSDQRDAAHGQKLVHQTSTDLLTWTDPVDDVAYAEYSSRPGMTTVTQLSNGDYVMTYEYGHNISGDYLFPVYYRINANPLEFNNSEGQPLQAKNTGTIPYGSPYITYSSSVGGTNGTIIVSSGGDSTVFTNPALGDVDEWYEWATPQPEAYTRHLRVFAENEDRLLIMGAGEGPPTTTINNVTLSVVDLEGLTTS